METFQLKYFKTIAETENIHESSKLLNVSPSALSKAISRLENELEVKLFQKIGRNIQITTAGLLLEKKVSELLALEEDISRQFKENQIDLPLKIVGSEMALSSWAPKIVKNILDKNQKISFNITSVQNNEVLNYIENYSADIGILFSPIIKSGKLYKELSKVSFHTYLSKKHPLFRLKKSIHINDIVNYPFIRGDDTLYGIDQSKLFSQDGWRDDKFKRSHINVTNSLRTLEAFVQEGFALAYLPDYLGQLLKLEKIKIEGCLFECSGYIYAVRNKYHLENIWSLF